MTTRNYKKAKRKYIKMIKKAQVQLKEGFRQTHSWEYALYLIYSQNHLPIDPKARSIMKRAIDLEWKSLKKIKKF